MSERRGGRQEVLPAKDPHLRFPRSNLPYKGAREGLVLTDSPLCGGVAPFTYSYTLPLNPHGMAYSPLAQGIPVSTNEALYPQTSHLQRLPVPTQPILSLLLS